MRAGNVYVVARHFDASANANTIKLVACTNSLATCSAPLVIASGGTVEGLPQVDSPQVAVRADGRITITWIELVLNLPPHQMITDPCIKT
jgi:hypothetical protein